MPPFIESMAIFLGIVVVAYLAGNYVTKPLRMPETGWKVTLIVSVIGFAVWILLTNWPPKQGIDLQGGVILVYEVDDELTQRSARRRQNEGADPSETGTLDVGRVDMPGLVQALSRRINPGGVHEIVVRPYGDRQVEVIIPDVSGPEVDEIKKLITTGGFLKFQIVANRRDHSHIWSLADEPDQVGQYEVRDASGNVVGQWAKLSLNPQAEEGDSPYRVDPPQAKSRTVRDRKEVLMVVDPQFSMQGSDLASVRGGFQGVSPAVFFDTTVAGARLMGALTASNLPDANSGHFSLLGIVMDGELVSAPIINSTITTSGLIEGEFTETEVDRLVNVLRAGRLPAVLRQEPISQNEISPLLGSDTIRQGKIAIGVSLVMVLLFMLVYYRFAGLVSCLALLLNLTLILALMIFVGAAFSLAGMAALVLTVGMSVDANVLIFERIREELKSGAALRMATRNGFQRATRTIVDANVTTLITAIVLYLIGTEQLRAFAVALILGILMTLFSAIFCSRVVFDIVEKTGRLKQLRMMQMFANTDWDLFTYRRGAVFVSFALITVGLFAIAIRGNRIFDIDFSGGTSIQLLLKEQMPMAEVRVRVDNMRAKKIAEDVSVTEVKSDKFGPGVIYRVDTSLRELDANATPDDVATSAIAVVQAALMEEFRDDQGESLLRTRSLMFTPPAANAPPSSQDVDPTLPEIESTESSELVDPTEDRNSQSAPTAVDGYVHQNLRSDDQLAFAPQAVLAQVDIANPLENSTVEEPSAPSSPRSDDSSLRSHSTLQFDERINADTLQEMILASAQSQGLGQPDVHLYSDDPTWDAGSSQSLGTWQVQLSNTPEQAERILDSLKVKLDSTPVWLSANQIGSSVAGDKTRLAIAAVLGSLIGIIAYIWIRFQHVSYGLAAVVALVHDVVITIGAIAASFWLKDALGFLMVDEFKISLPVVAALLTIIGYSLNDTIVVFDRIREVKGKSPRLTEGIINTSINQTLSRTLLTSLTTLLAVGILYGIGGQGIHAFAFALMVGVIVGTYSSIFVASPALLMMTKSTETNVRAPQKVTV